MPIPDVEIVVRPIDVARDDGGELTAMLLRIGPVHNINHPLGETVAEVAVMRRTIVDLRNALVTPKLYLLLFGQLAYCEHTF